MTILMNCNQVSRLFVYIFIYTYIYEYALIYIASGAVLGNPVGPVRQRVVLTCVTQAQVLDAERCSNSHEKLAAALLSLLFSTTELAHGNCTKPVRGDIKQLNSERLWAIRCKKMYICILYYTIFTFLQAILTIFTQLKTINMRSDGPQYCKKHSIQNVAKCDKSFCNCHQITTCIPSHYILNSTCILMTTCILNSPFICIHIYTSTHPHLILNSSFRKHRIKTLRAVSYTYVRVRSTYAAFPHARKILRAEAAMNANFHFERIRAHTHVYFTTPSGAFSRLSASVIRLTKRA